MLLAGAAARLYRLVDGVDRGLRSEAVPVGAVQAQRPRLRHELAVAARWGESPTGGDGCGIGRCDAEKGLMMEEERREKRQRVAGVSCGGEIWI